MINYSWTHAGIWSLAKRSVLPATAISRVFFPTQQELADYFSTSMLPKGKSCRPNFIYHNWTRPNESLTDYGGTLASLTELHDPLWNDPPSPQLGVGSGEPTAEPESPSSAPSIARIVAEAAAPSITAISATSLLNPFFGYPVSSSGGLPSLHHGRRRKRDLARTLLILAWRRWRRHLMACVWILVFVLTVRGRRAWFIRSSKAVKSIWGVTYGSIALL
jgi:retinaldehyde-binding protein 1